MFFQPYAFVQTPLAGAQIPWTPAEISTSLWFDASVSSSVSLSGTSVTQWNDLSGNNRHVSQSSAGSQPTYNSTGSDGKGTITFDGSNDILFTAACGASGLTSVSMITVFRMVSFPVKEQMIMGIGATGTQGTVRAFYKDNTTPLRFSGWGADVSATTYTYETGSFNIFEVWNTQLATPNNLNLGKNGEFETKSTSNNLQTTADGFSIGSLRGGLVANYYTNVEVAEIIVLYSAVDTTNRQLIEGYLAWKWGLEANLPADHPYKNSPPYV